MSNSVDPDEMAHDEPSHLDLCCLQKPIIIACGSERVYLSLIMVHKHGIQTYIKSECILKRGTMLFYKEC